MLSAPCSPARAETCNPGQTWHPSLITRSGDFEFPESKYCKESSAHFVLISDQVITNIQSYQPSADSARLGRWAVPW